MNITKSSVVHFRKGKLPTVDFQLENWRLNHTTVEQYRYLGIIFHKILKFQVAADILWKAGGRALGATIYKIPLFKDVCFESFESLFNSCVVPELDYYSGVWDMKIFYVLITTKIVHYVISYDCTDLPLFLLYMVKSDGSHLLNGVG